MEKWIKERLSVCLDFEVPDDMIHYIMSMKSSNELDEYFESLLNTDYDVHRLFIADCKQKLFNKAIPGKKKANQSNQPQLAKPINKKQEEQSSNSRPNETTGKKKKTKYVNLFSNDGKVPNTIVLKGRHACECQASEHNLINNCLTCGRIVCQQEGSGPCLFCGELVCSAEEQKLINSSTKEGEKLKKDLQGKGEELRTAMALRDRLLNYEQNSEQRTQVIDDEMDYFQDNSVWLSDAEREKFEKMKQEVHELKHKPRSALKIRMDLLGREIVEDALPEEYENKVRKEISDSLAKHSTWSQPQQEQHLNTGLTDPIINCAKPFYIPQATEEDNSPLPFDSEFTRVQDKELLEMQDMRQCISMHQPYASLLVAGIKKHEGRVWYTNHRGRLWIASTAKEPTREEINDVETFYKKHYKDDSIRFPSQYPTGCLLGCVIVQDVFTQEEYREVYPDGESESPYVFICSRPQMLQVVFPIKGSHKIYKLDLGIHSAASLALVGISDEKI